MTHTRDCRPTNYRTASERQASLKARDVVKLENTPPDAFDGTATGRQSRIRKAAALARNG